MPAHSQTRYAASLEKMSMIDVEATFGEVAKNEWRRSLNEWIKFGEYEYPAFNDASEKIRIDDITNPKRLEPRSDNARYWTNRWSDQMNYRYWKDRCATEMTDEGVKARQLFYYGTLAYKKSEFKTAVEKFREGLEIWQKLLTSHKDYRDDDLNKKDTGLVVKRYVRAMRQYGEPEPKDFPFKALLKDAEKDTTLDPFDAMEMLPVSKSSSGSTPKSGPTPRSSNR